MNASSALRRGGSRCLHAHKFAASLLSPTSWFLGVHSQAPERPRPLPPSENIRGRGAGNVASPPPYLPAAPAVLLTGQGANGKRFTAPRTPGQKQREVPVATAAAAPRAAGSHLPGRPPLAAGSAASARRKGAGPLWGRGSWANSAQPPSPRSRPRPLPCPPANAAARSAPMQICRGPRYSFRKAPSPPRLRLLVPVPSSGLSALFLCCANKRVFWINGKTGSDRCNQALSLSNYIFNRLNVSDFRGAGSGIKLEAKENQEETGVACPPTRKIQEQLVLGP